ncbi:MAG TPA: NAD-dependent epimerase/dehydratase family protein [Actinoplanes sp.]|nr:NAD-dependent epimerase/dehydratase family protein [Actinoplanes sp.]
MEILVLGGTGFVGRAVADLAVQHGHQVTVLNRGHHDPPPGVTALTGDRTAPDGLTPVGGRDWDAVVDTWPAAPRVVRDAARTLSGHAGHYTYISSRSVYADPGDDTPAGPLTEDHPVVDADPGAGTTTYAADKRGGELATTHFDGPVLLARAGLILGPHEDIGRLPWWLLRLARGGPTLAPGPADLPLQYIDARDLAQFCLAAAADRLTGPYNLVSPAGHTTMGELLTTANTITGGHADLRWLDPDVILAAGVQPWTDLPIWLPPGPEHDLLHHADVTKAMDAGLRLRPVGDTIADTWAWLQDIGGTPPHRPDRPPVGLSPDVEARLLGR